MEPESVLERTFIAIEDGSDTFFDLINEVIDLEELNDGETLLYKACLSGNELFVFRLLRRKAGVNTPTSNGETPIFAAVTTFNLSVVRILQREGAELDIRNERGKTSLGALFEHYDCEDEEIKRKTLEIVEHLLGNGCSPNIPDRRGRTPTHAAVETQNQFIIQAFAKAGADFNYPDDSGETPQYIMDNCYYPSTS